MGGATLSLSLSLSSVLARPCAQVTHLVIKRPQFFHFKPGDYVYINIPVIAKYEWHPFTISSAPEQSGRPRFPATTGRHRRLKEFFDTVPRFLVGQCAVYQWRLFLL